MCCAEIEDGRGSSNEWSSNGSSTSTAEVKENISTLTKNGKSAALRDRCMATLGDSFQAIYSYLRRARSSGSADEREVRRQLMALVGGNHSLMPGCFAVDQLIFLEMNYV